MCQIRKKLFYKCGHTEQFNIPSLNPICAQRVEVLAYDFDTICNRCKIPEESKATSLISRLEQDHPCGAFQGKVIANYSVRRYNKLTQALGVLWSRRERFMREFAEYISTLDPEDPMDNFPTIPKNHIPESKNICAICQGSLVLHGEAACQGRQAVKLPCGHIFGRECIRMITTMPAEAARNKCPFCRKDFSRDHLQEARGFVSDSLRNRVFDLFS